MGVFSASEGFWRGRNRRDSLFFSLIIGNLARETVSRQTAASAHLAEQTYDLCQGPGAVSLAPQPLGKAALPIPMPL